MNQPFVYLHRRGYRLVLRVLPALTVLCVIMALFFPPLRSVAILLFMVQLLWVGLQFRQTSAEHAILAKRQSLLYKYQGMFQVIENSSFQSPLLTEIHNELTRGEQAASHSIQSLARIVAAFDNRLNVLVALFLEGLLLWDMQCLLRLEHWRKTGSSSFEAWIAALARFDALVSLANLAFNQPELTYPEFSEQEVLTASRMGHLLISPADRVYNDFRLERPGDFVLITGANMAGKSTFLRTVASNIVLAMAGAPVCAASLVWKPTKLYSSMRTSDSLNKHESYFYAELKRLKELLDCLRNGEALFILLDEILKGTNSTDKQKGSRAVMEQILARQGTGIIATHDLELTKLEQQYPGRVRNLCFEIEIDRGLQAAQRGNHQNECAAAYAANGYRSTGASGIANKDRNCSSGECRNYGRNHKTPPGVRILVVSGSPDGWRETARQRVFSVEHFGFGKRFILSNFMRPKALPSCSWQCEGIMEPMS